MDKTHLTPFLDFARLHDVHIDPQRLQADGRIHRADVGDRPNGRNDAAYLLREDGTGWVTNFKADGKPIAFRPELARSRTPDEQQKAKIERAAWLQQQAERQKAALTDSLARWEASHEPRNFPYLQNPALPTAGLRQHSAQLLVPMLKLTDGEPEWVGMQRIAWAAPGQSADKRFVAGTPTQGAFAVIPIDGQDAEAPLRAFEAAKTAPHVVMCEGIGTALALHQATGLPVIAALSAQNLPEVARALHDQVQGRVTLYADNDGERAAHKGQINALKAARILGSAHTTIALPEKPNGVTPPGYDARDQLRDSGLDAIRNTLDRAVPPWTFQRSHPGIARPTGQGQQPLSPTPHLKQEKPMGNQLNKELTSWRAATRITAYRAAETGSLSPEQIEAGLTDRHSHVRAAAVRHALAPTAQPSEAQVERGLTDKSPDVRAAWAASPRSEMTPAQVERALTDSDSFVRRVTLGREDTRISPQQAERALTDPDKLVRRDAIARGLPLTPVQIESALTDKAPEVRLAILQRPDIQLTSAQGRRAMEDTHQWVKLAALERPDVKPATSDLDAALGDKNIHLANKIEDRWKRDAKQQRAAEIDPALLAALSDEPPVVPKRFEIDAALLAALDDDPTLPLHPAIEPVSLRPGDQVVADLRAIRPTQTGQESALMQAGERSLQVTREEGQALPDEMKPLVGQRVEFSIGGDSKEQVRSVPITIDPALLRALSDDPPDIEPEHRVQVQAPAKAQAQFAELNAALDQTEKEPAAPFRQTATPEHPQDNGEQRLLQSWREASQPARETRAKAWQDLNAQQQAARESLFSTLAQQRAETLKDGGDLDVHAFEAAKQIEHLQKAQAAQRKTLTSSLPLPPTLREFLEPRAEHDPIAARLLEQEKTRDPSKESIRGRRVADVEPEVLDGLTHDIEDGPPKAVHYARDGEKVMTDRGERVDLYHVDDREIESALRLAEQKYDMDKGLQLTGSREFQERAAEIAGRMGLKVQNPELQQTWQLGRLQTLQSEELGADTRLTAPAVGQGAIESARPEHRDGRTYAVDTQALQAEALLAKLDIHGFDALDRASRYQPLTPDQRMALQGHDEQTRLIDDQDRLTPLGKQVTERMWAKIETEREQLQQQLRTRNIDEELKKREAQEEKREHVEDKAQDKAVEREIVAHERAEERAEEREVEAPQRAPVRPRPRQPSRDMGLGG